MDYEKKYKEALERARKWYNNPNSSSIGKSYLYAVFPELKESEDERILEIIKHCIESRYLHTSTIKGISQKQCFAWLEKQGEQTSADETSYPETLEKAIDLYYYSYGNGEGEFEHLSLEKFRDIVHTFVSYYGQKPAWSEKDEHRVKDTIYFLDTAKKHYASTIELDACIDWLKAIKQRMGE